MFTSSLRAPPRPIWKVILPATAGLMGGAAAAAGLLLSAGGGRFVLAFLALGALVLAAARAAPQMRATAARLGLRAGLFALLAVCGAAAGLLALGRAEADLWPPVAATGLTAVLAAAGAGLGGAALGRGRTVIWAALALAFALGAATGAGAGQYVTWATARYALWGAASGAALLAALCGLALAPREASAVEAGTGVQRALLFVVVALVLIDAALPLAWNDTGYFNLYTHQARAFLAGRLDIEVTPGVITDVAYFGDKQYVPLLPFPAVLLMPVVWVADAAGQAAVPMRVFSALVTALSAALLSKALSQAQVAARQRYWIVAGFVFGTGLWFTTLGTDDSGGNLAHDVAVLCLLLAVVAAFRRGRGLWAGLFLGLAALSRPTAIFGGIFVAGALLHERGGWRPRLRALAGFGAGLSILLALYLLFNYYRFGNPFDTGFTAYLTPSGSFLWERYTTYGSFNIVYVWQNLYYFFLHGFHLQFEGSTLLTPAGMDPFGTSLVVASPFLFAALRARWEPRLLWPAWAAVGLAFITQLFYFNNGYHQINTQRYMLDYLPILILLAGRATGRVRPAILQGAIVYSIGLNLIALFLAA